MFRVGKIMFHAADGFLWQGFDRVSTGNLPYKTQQKTEDLE